MRRFLLVAIPLALVALLVLIHMLPKGTYRLPFADMEVESITLYLSSESTENGKKHITEETDIDVFLAMMDKMRVQGKYRDRNIPDGGHFLGAAFHLTDGSTFLCTYYETSAYGKGLFTDGERRFKASNLKLLDHWYSLDYKMFPLESSELEIFPSIWEN